MASVSAGASIRRRRSLSDYADGPFAPFVGAGPVAEVDRDGMVLPEAAAGTIFVAHRLEFERDHRRALQSWFNGVAIGGHLLLVVSHAFLFERRLSLPSRWFPAQRRLYTPRLLMDEVEEALPPNSYRVRLLADDDRGYDYAAPSGRQPAGHGDILLALERIAPPSWPLDEGEAGGVTAPDFAFERERTRVEVSAVPPRRRILLLKLDHLGDFVMAVPALEKARAAFADAELTLVVGSWNAAMARDLGLADNVIAFDAFPRNSSEEEVDVAGMAAPFRAAVPGAYDVAIDLRTDTDTRVLLRVVRAGVRAGIGSRARFPFLDIFLPVDATRGEAEVARATEINHHAFASQSPVIRGDHRVHAVARDLERHGAIVWGPYHRLEPGQYIFQPYIELARDPGEGALMLDVALDAHRVAELTLPMPGRPQLAFRVDRPEAAFEFRIWAVDDRPAIDFSFFGGRLLRAGAASVLHQSEYQALLIELVRLRLDEGGMLADADIR